MFVCCVRVREKYLKPEGALYPSHCSMFWALVDDEEERHAKANEFSQALQVASHTQTHM